MANKKFLEAIKRIYGKPASLTIIKGEWKTGKTDFSLYLSECLLNYGIIKEAGANIETTDNPNKKNIHVEYIDNFQKLKLWGYGSDKSKVYVFDEALKNASSREAMTKLNKAWIKIIPEISKMRMHIIIITQKLKYIETLFKDPTFNHGTWEKIDLNPKHKLFRKKVTLVSKRYYKKKLTFCPIPKTSIKFNAYLGATLSLEPEDITLKGCPIPVQIAIDYFEGLSTDQLKVKYALPTRKEASRQIKKGGLMLKRVCHVSTNLRWDNGGSQMTQLSKSDD